MSDGNGNPIGNRLVELASAVRDLDSTAILTAFWYVVLVAVVVYSLYLAAVSLRNSFPAAGALIRRIHGYLRGRR